MKYEADYEEYDKEEEVKPKKYFKEPEYGKDEEPRPKKNFKESECGEIKIKAENVYITINCKEKKERKDY